MFDTLIIDIDISDTFKLTVKLEPQPLHWCHEVITNSRIVKLLGEKNYHPYVSDSKKLTKDL